MQAQLSAAEQEQIVLHLNDCDHCQQLLDRLSTEGEPWAAGLRGLGDKPPHAEPGLQQVLKNLQKDANRTDTEAGADSANPALDFLSPSSKPGHLGRLGHYEILEVVGRGGMGIVLRAFDEVLHRVVAIKVLSPHLASNATARRRFTREAQAAAAVTHEHVVTIHGVEDGIEPPYIVMQYVSGVSLQERLDKSGPLELKEILRIGMQTASGLAAAHAQGLIHRDVKPSNILLENGVERVKITDFGLARMLDDASLTQSGVVAGTPQYMSPEQANGETVDIRADLFSLGSVLYALCTGRPPFRASTVMGVLKRVCEEEPRPVREVNPDIPDWLAAIIEKLHAKDPADRFQSTAEVADLLGQHLAHLQEPSQTPWPPAIVRMPAPRAPRRQRSVALWVIVAVAVTTFACCLLPVGLVLFYMVGWVALSGMDDGPQVAAVIDEARIAGQLPFLVLDQNGMGRTYESNLVQAVEAARDGDIIEIQASGTFESAPIRIEGKHLTIRAAIGQRPVIHLAAQAALDTKPLIETNAPLMLQDLVFQREVTSDGTPGHPERNAFIKSDRALLHVANCRFLGGRGCIGIWSSESQSCTVRNCEFLGPDFHCAIDWNSPAAGELKVENCIFLVGPHGLVLQQRQLLNDKVTVRLVHNTISASVPVGYWYWLPVGKILGAVRVEAFDNIFDARSYVLEFRQIDQPEVLSAKEAQAALPKLLSWEGTRNLYSAGDHFLLLSWADMGKPPTPSIQAPGIRTFFDWRDFWQGEDSGLQARIRFASDVMAKAQRNCAELQPSDFRLVVQGLEPHDSFGARLDRVGPSRPPQDRH
jgi:hypothetical protein